MSIVPTALAIPDHSNWRFVFEMEWEVSVSGCSGGGSSSSSSSSSSNSSSSRMMSLSHSRTNIPLSLTGLKPGQDQNELGHHPPYGYWYH